MQITFVLMLVLHMLSGVFWAGSTFALARTGGAQSDRLFLPQMGAAAVAMISGGALWHFLHEGSFQLSEQILAAGALCALGAAGVQGVLIGPVRHLSGDLNMPEMASRVRRIPTGHRIAAGLLVITLVCMAVARYV
jgi:hypothetical protein